MKIFKKKYDPKNIYLLTTEIVSSCNDGSGLGPRTITKYYLVTKRGKKFYELFSKVEITYKDSSVPGVVFFKFDTPTIKHVENLEKYVRNPDVKLTSEELFYFITEKNTSERVEEDIDSDET